MFSVIGKWRYVEVPSHFVMTRFKTREEAQVYANAVPAYEPIVVPRELEYATLLLLGAYDGNQGWTA